MTGKIYIHRVKRSEFEKEADKWYEKLKRGEDIHITFRDRDVLQAFLKKYGTEDIIIDVDGKEYTGKELRIAIINIGVDMFTKP